MEEHNVEDKKEESFINSDSLKTKAGSNKNQTQIASAIIIAGVIIAGAILMKGNNAPTLETNKPISKMVGLNVKSFNTCLESEKFKDKVQADIDDGTKAGVNGTPSSFILKNGFVVDTIEGAQPFEAVIQKIEKAQTTLKEPIGAEIQIRPVSPDDHILGNADAKIIVVEYSDLECPFCKVFHNTMHQVVEKSNGDVAWVYRHYPISGLHPKAFLEALATECAWEQKGNDGFWKYTDQLFKITPSNNKFDEKQL